MRISDWSSDVCSSDLLCSGPDVRTTLCSVHGIEQRQSAIIYHAIAIDETGPGTLQGSLKPPVPGAQAPGAGHATFPADPVIEKKAQPHDPRSEEHTSELQSLMRISYAVFCLKKKKSYTTNHTHR